MIIIMIIVHVISVDGNDNKNGYFACYSTIIFYIFFSRFTCLAHTVDV